jgi:uroporphyrinogen-III synthase
VRVLITRPAQDSARTAALLAARGHVTLSAPLFTVEPLTPARPAAVDAVIAASANAVRMAQPELLQPFLDCPFLAVGDATADAAARAGFRHVTSAAGAARDLAALVERVLPEGAAILHLAGIPRRDEALQAVAGRYQVSVAETYETVAVEELPAAIRDALTSHALDAVLHFSPRAAEVFAQLAEKAGLLEHVARLQHVFISSAARDPRLPPGKVAENPGLESVVNAL